jgi:hypothetical protein
MGFCNTHCTDAAINGDETDLNCGGMECGNPCNPGQMCQHNSDCMSNNCLFGTCQ